MKLERSNVNNQLSSCENMSMDVKYEHFLSLSMGSVGSQSIPSNTLSSLNTFSYSSSSVVADSSLDIRWRISNLQQCR